MSSATLLAVLVSAVGGKMLPCKQEQPSQCQEMQDASNQEKQEDHFIMLPGIQTCTT